jgi:hypothetical protein
VSTSSTRTGGSPVTAATVPKRPTARTLNLTFQDLYLCKQRLVEFLPEMATTEAEERIALGVAEAQRQVIEPLWEPTRQLLFAMRQQGMPPARMWKTAPTQETRRSAAAPADC